MSSPQCLRNVHILDAETASIARGQSVVIRDGRIEAVLHASQELPGQTFDGSGRYLCPGLIDCHVHLFLDGGDRPTTTFLQRDDAARIGLARHNARVALEAGITTVRDCGAPASLMFELQRQVEKGDVIGPHIVSCGSPLMRPEGHCHFFGGEVADVPAIRRAVESQLRHGAGFVKLIASGGGLTPGTDPSEADLPLELMKAAVETAHAHGVLVTAHCHATDSIVRAIDAGLDMIEHCSFVDSASRHRYSEEISRRIRDNDIIVSPTVYGALQTARRFRAAADGDDARRSIAVERLEGRLTNTTHFVRLGLRIIGGTDGGVTDTPSDSLVDELLCYTQAGMSNAEALRTVTSQSAAMMGLTGVGAIKPGYRADFVLLAEDPLADLNALRRPVAVYKSGRLVHQSAGYSQPYDAERVSPPS